MKKGSRKGLKKIDGLQIFLLEYHQIKNFASYLLNNSKMKILLISLLLVCLLAFSQAQDEARDPYDVILDWKWSSSGLRGPLNDLQSIMDGFWITGGLKAPVYEIKCFTRRTAQEVLDGGAKILSFLSSYEFEDALDEVEDYIHYMYHSRKKCLWENSETHEVMKAYGLDNFDLDDFKARFLRYVKLNREDYRNRIEAFQKNVKLKQFFEIGVGIGQMLQKVMKS